MLYIMSIQLIVLSLLLEPKVEKGWNTAAWKYRGIVFWCLSRTRYHAVFNGRRTEIPSKNTGRNISWQNEPHISTWLKLASLSALWFTKSLVALYIVICDLRWGKFRTIPIYLLLDTVSIWIDLNTPNTPILFTICINNSGGLWYYISEP